MKQILLRVAVFLTLALIISNCDEDTCPTCPPKATGPSLYAIGSVNKNGNNFWAHVEVFDVTGSGDQVDSAQVDGDFTRFCIRNTPHTAANDGRQILTYFGSSDCPAGGAYFEFIPGDTSEVSLYCHRIAHSVKLHLLDRSSSRPGNVQLTVDEPSNQVTVTWDPVADAEWYAVKMKTQYLAPPYQWEYYNLESTTLTAPLPIPYSGVHEVLVYVAAGTGPKPTSDHPTHNLTGKYITGSIYSISSDVLVQQIVNPFALNAQPENDDSPPSIAELLKHGGRLSGGN